MSGPTIQNRDRRVAQAIAHPRCRRLQIHGDLASDGGASAWRRSNLELTPDGVHPVAHTAQAHPLVAERQAHSRPVIGHLEPDALASAVSKYDRYANVLASVLDRVLRSLEDAEVDGGFDGRGEPSDSLVDHANSDRRPGRHRADSGRQALVGEHRRIYAAREGSQLVYGELDICADRCELSAHVGQRRFLGHLQFDLDRYQPLLRAVMQVSLQLSPLAVCGPDDSRVSASKLPTRLIQCDVEFGVLPREKRDQAGGITELRQMRRDGWTAANQRSWHALLQIRSQVIAPGEESPKN